MDNDTPMVDGVEYKIDVPAKIFQIELMCLAFPGESLGYQVTWDPLLYQVIMNKCPEDQGKYNESLNLSQKKPEL